MADRNPYIPSERAADVENKDTAHEDEANERFAENKAELTEESADYPQGSQDHKPKRAEHHGEAPGGKPKMRSMDEAAPKAS